MSLKRKIKSKKQGVSPVIGIILMVLVTVSLIGLAVVALSDPSELNLIADTDSDNVFRQPLTINGVLLIVVFYHIIFIDTSCDCE